MQGGAGGWLRVVWSSVGWLGGGVGPLKNCYCPAFWVSCRSMPQSSIKNPQPSGFHAVRCGVNTRMARTATRRVTLGGASRLRRCDLPWADMLRPLRGENQSGLLGIETRSSVLHAPKGYEQDSPGQNERRSRETLPRADRSSAHYPMLRRGETGTIWRKEKAPPR